MAYRSTRLATRNPAARFQGSVWTTLARAAGSACDAAWARLECALGRGAGLLRGLTRSSTRLSKLTGTAKMSAQMRPSRAGDIRYLARGRRRAVACASDIDMTVLPGRIRSTVPGLPEKMN